jgi:hypothetical protein
MMREPHQREIHFTEWIVRIRDGLPESIPPKWIDPHQTPDANPAATPCATAARSCLPPRVSDAARHVSDAVAVTEDGRLHTAGA